MRSRAAEVIADFVASIVMPSTAGRPLIIGLSGPQGSGKSTASAAAVALLKANRLLNGIAISIDDFYLTRADQLKLAAQHAENFYLQQRGYPGTHDIRLGAETLRKLKAINASGQSVVLPRYDKSLHDGEGDRADKSAWPTVTAPLDFVILEGWCVGFTPVAAAAIQNAQLAEINHMLARYAAWHEFFDAFIQLKAGNIRDTVRWRIEAEENMRAQGKPGMSEAHIRAYIEKFLPAYELYLPGLGTHPPVASPRLIMEIATDRSVPATLYFS